jgi:STE24 endopeptidase
MMAMNGNGQRQAKRYERIQHLVFVFEAALVVAGLGVFLVSGASEWLAERARAVSPNPWVNVTLYGVAVIAGASLALLPVSFFAGFWLEHRFGLSTQSLARWWVDRAKSFGLSLLLGVLGLNAVYLFLRQAGDWWWLAAGGFFLVFGAVLSAVFPVWILPLFYTLRPLENETLRRRLEGLAARVGAQVLGVYRLAMSEKTRKANAAFAGLGRTKRIILGDTLLERFTEDEIEVVMAHEMAHYKHGDLWKLLGWSSLTTLAGLKIADWVMRAMLPRVGFEQISQVGAFPLLALCLFGFGLVTMPLNNAFSRWRERKADRVALELTGNRDGFIRAMRKLAEQNLADLQPHPWIEFLLYDHPSLGRRIAWAERWEGSSA